MYVRVLGEFLGLVVIGVRLLRGVMLRGVGVVR